MKLQKTAVGAIALAWGAVLLLSACTQAPAQAGIMEELRAAPVVKLEYSGQEDSEPLFADNVGTTASVADMRLQATDEEFQEDWLYRFTYNPAEKVRDGREIVLLFGASSLWIDGTAHLPEDGVAYDSILEWAEGVYRYCAE